MSAIRRLLPGVACAVLASCGGDGGGTQPPPAPADVATVGVTGPAAQPVPGETVQLVATVRDAEGNELTDRAVAWTSSSAAIAAVSETGVATAVAAGTATITATSEGKQGTLSLTVQDGGLIGPDGGTVTARGGNVRLVVPAGAVAEAVAIVVSPAAHLPVDPSSVSGSGYSLAPATTTFAQPATLTLRYLPTNGPSGVPETDFRVHRLQSGALESLGGEVDPATDAASAEVTGLGTFAVGRAPAQSPCTDPEYRQFDFWVGQWNVTVPGQTTPPNPSDITLEPGGCAVFENFANGAGLSLNVYSPEDGQWHQTFFFSSGQRTVLVGGLEGDAMVLTGTFPGLPGSFNRWTWTQLSGGRVRQLQETSQDGGTTVQVGFDGTYTPR